MLTERQLEIVLAVVYEYIQTGAPVGSRTLSRKFLKEHSAATIRNEMSDLEEMGYFSQPHSSAGRLPTSNAYRVYVDSILHHPSTPAPDVEAAVRQIDNQMQGLEEKLTEISRFLGRLTRCFGVAAVKMVDQFKLKKVDFIKTSSTLVVVVLVLEGGIVQHRHFTVSPVVTQEILDQLSETINRMAAGKMWREVRKLLFDYLAQRIADWESCQPAADQVDRLMQDANLSFSTSTEGIKDLVDLRESADFGRFQAILALVNEDRGLEDLIQNCTGKNGTKVTIGIENERPSMKNCSVVMASASDGGRQSVVGLIGPMRMNYEHSIAVLEAVLGALNKPPINGEAP